MTQALNRPRKRGSSSADDSVPFAHAKVGYRQAIHVKNPGLERVPGFFVGQVKPASAGLASPQVRIPGPRTRMHALLAETSTGALGQTSA